MANAPQKFTTPWGQWWQEDEEVYIEVNVPKDTKPNDVQINLSKLLPTLIEIVVQNKIIISVSILAGSNIMNVDLFT